MQKGRKLGIVTEGSLGIGKITKSRTVLTRKVMLSFSNDRFTELVSLQSAIFTGRYLSFKFGDIA